MNMYTVKLFSAATTGLLQHEINEWMRMNKDILIHGSSMAVTEKAAAGDYNFYVLYTGPDTQDAGLKEMAAAVTQEQSIEVKDMNPEIMKPSS